ncbi:MAG: hypothetical protein HYX27_11615 [Acidobacteria bacterium]|nr:hypothetical protein [Acidobacteriota bacterium]
MKIPRSIAAVSLLLTFVALGGIAGAAPITGIVNISGSAGVNATSVDFFGNALSGCSTAGVGVDGCFLINVPLSGSFVGLTPGTVGGTIKDLQGPPISGNISLPAFMSFTNGVFFDLTRVVPGGAPNCAGVNGSAANATCTPVINGQVSPFVLTNSSDGSNASVFFNVQLLGYTGTLGTGSTFYVGAFNTPSAGKNIAGILADIANGLTVSAAYSANFAPGSNIPEPDTRALFGIGLAAILVGALRRKSSRT